MSDPVTKKQYLGGAIDDYLIYRKSTRIAAGTLRNETSILGRLAKVAGPIQVGSLSDAHMIAWWAEAAHKTSSSLTVDYSVGKGFIAWCQRTRRMARWSDPMEGIPRPKRDEKERRRVPRKDFDRLLDAATHPRDRIWLACALYLILRSNEIGRLRLADVNFDAQTVRCRISKGRYGQVKERDLPMSAELEGELRKWVTYYTVEQGSLNPSWFLVPAKHPPRWTRDPETGNKVRWGAGKPDPLKPDVPFLRNTYDVAKAALEKIGWDLRDPVTGKSMQEGMHTLRRSGARALDDALAAQYGDRATKLVQIMMNHKNRSQTEGYIGKAEDMPVLHEAVAGKIMYPVDRSNVLSLPGSSRAVGDQQKEAAYGTPS